jgi:hypothetical protein
LFTPGNDDFAFTFPDTGKFPLKDRFVSQGISFADAGIQNEKQGSDDEALQRNLSSYGYMFALPTD